MDDATGKRHHCMRGSYEWPQCATRKWKVCEVVTEFYVVSAGGQPVEKWREWRQHKLGFREASVEYCLLWRAPFSNFSQVNFPRVPRGGRIQEYSGEMDDISVRIRLLGGEYWEFPKGEDKVVDGIRWYLENRRF